MSSESRNHLDNVLLSRTQDTLETLLHKLNDSYNDKKRLESEVKQLNDYIRRMTTDNEKTLYRLQQDNIILKQRLIDSENVIEQMTKENISFKDEIQTTASTIESLEGVLIDSGSTLKLLHEKV